jgi:arylsulfatase A-like enzyme
MLGAFGLGGKSCMYEDAARVPLVVSLPGQRQQRRVTAPVSQVDLLPTLLDALGQPVPDGLHGASLALVLAGKEKEPGRDVFLQWETGPVREAKPARIKPGQEKFGTPEQIAAATRERIRAIVTRDGWKFCRNGLGTHELYDLNTDPQELHNLAGNAAQQDRIADLQQRITAWQGSVSDPG